VKIAKIKLDILYDILDQLMQIKTELQVFLTFKKENLARTVTKTVLQSVKKVQRKLGFFDRLRSG
jgi:hypothetical protein